MSVDADLMALLPDTVAAQVHAVIPDLVTCHAIAGSVDAAELKRIGSSAPAVLVALLGLKQDAKLTFPQIGYSAEMAAFVVTRRESGQEARHSGTIIAQTVMRLIPENSWELADCGPAVSVSASPLVNKETRAIGIHLMMVSWTQPVVLETITSADPVDLSVYASQAPLIGVDNTEAYELIAGPAPEIDP